MLTFCAQPGGGRFANDPQVTTAVRRFYDANAVENLPGCTAPLLVFFRDVQVTWGATPGPRNLVRLFVRYNFEQRDPRDASLICSGTETRHFRVVREQTGVRVLGMDGPSRGSS